MSQEMKTSHILHPTLSTFHIANGTMAALSGLASGTMIACFAFGYPFFLQS